MALHLPIEPLKPALGWSRDTNPVPTSPLADDLATAPSGPVLRRSLLSSTHHNVCFVNAKWSIIILLFIYLFMY